MSLSAVGRQSFLIVFDFDHTLIDCNSDEAIPWKLGRKAMMRSMMHESNTMQWTKLIDTLIAPFTKQQIEDVISPATINIDPHMNDLLEYLQSIRNANSVVATPNSVL